MKLTSICQGETEAGATVVSIHIEGRSPYWPDLGCQPCVYAAVSRYHDDPRLRPWHVECYLELADRHRTQWSVVRGFETRDEAAREAADFALIALPLLRRSLAGETVWTPGQRRELAAQAPARAAVAKLRSRATLLEASFASHERENDEAACVALRGRLQEVHEEIAETERRAVRDYHASHDWREYIGDVVGRTP